MKRKSAISIVVICFLIIGLSTVLLACDDNNSIDNEFYKITFNDYDGTLLLEIDVVKGGVPKYSKTVPTRGNDGEYSYVFEGWEPKLDKATKDTTYTAKYKRTELPYTISFNLNGGTTESEIKSLKTDIITKDIFAFDITKDGYIFKGWSYNGELVFNSEGEKISNITAASNMTFVAEFVKQTKLTIYYTMYNPNSNSIIDTFYTLPENMGSVSEGRLIEMNENVELFANPNEGYTFVGWYTAKNDKVYPLASESNYSFKMWEDDVVIEARFSYKLYSFKAFANKSDDGQVLINDDTYYYAQNTKQKYFTEEVTIAANTKTETRFLGWFDENNEQVSPNAVFTFKMLNRDYTLEAKWDNFAITYDLDGGVNNENNPSAYNTDIGDIDLLDPIKDGYTFVGWTYNDEYISVIKSDLLRDIHLVAHWTYYTLTTKQMPFDGSFSVNLYSNDDNNRLLSTQTVNANTALVYPSIPTRANYAFKGWYLDSSCTTLYDFSSDVISDVDLYAGWSQMLSGYSSNYINAANYNSSSNAYSISTANTNSTSVTYTYFTAYSTKSYTLYYKNSSSSSNYGTYLYIYNATQDVTIRTNINCTNTTFSGIGFQANAGDIIYVRNYRYNTSYSATFYFYIDNDELPVAGGKATVGEITEFDSEKITAGSIVNITATPLAEGIYFAGWFNEGTLVSSNKTYTFIMPKESVIYEAHWNSSPITIIKNISLAGDIDGVPSTIAEGDYITITATENVGYNWIGWYDENGLVSSSKSYSMTYANESIILIAKWKEDEKSIFYYTTDSTGITITGLKDSTVTNIVIPDGVSQIANEAFEYNNTIKKVIISESVTSIGNRAFASCYNLKTVIIYGDRVVNMGSDVFGSTWDSNDFRIYVPDSLYDEYYAIDAAYWQTYCAGGNRIHRMSELS